LPLVLAMLETDFTVALADQLVSASLSHWHALRIRQILGCRRETRLPVRWPLWRSTLRERG
jgi:hypothetical protein